MRLGEVGEASPNRVLVVKFSKTQGEKATLVDDIQDHSCIFADSPRSLSSNDETVVFG